MANPAMGYATQLSEIGFPEFTTKLITDTFDALIGANIRQQEAYITLLEATSKSLTAFINDTKDDISPEEVIQLLTNILPLAGNGSSTTVVHVGGNLESEDAETLNDALEVTDAGENINEEISAGGIDQNVYASIIDAASVRLAANKYTLLQEMVKQGMLRLVITDGKIETRLNFRAYGSDTLSKQTRDIKQTSIGAKADVKTGGLLSAWVQASVSASYNTMNVSTVDTQANSVSGVDTTVSGGVTINFRTDYLPIADA